MYCIIALLGSATCFSMLGVLARMVKSDLSTWEICLGRALVGVLCVLVLHVLLKVQIDGPSRPVLLVRGLSGAICFLNIVAAMQQLPIGMAMVLFYLFPVFAALLTPLINNEPVRRLQWVFVSISFAGILLLLGPGFGAVDLSFGHVFAVTAAFFGGLNICLVRRLSCDHSPFCIYMYMSLVAIAVSVVPAFQHNQLVIPPAYALYSLLAIGVLGTGAQLSLNYGFVHLRASEGSLVLMSQVPMSMILGFVLFHEPIGGMFVAGAVLILVSSWGLFSNVA
ncbi:MAG: DMT family transporter [Desulfobacterales bacterium]|nr:DMT family transporter [Desulfobacterales bacterium]